MSDLPFQRPGSDPGTATEPAWVAGSPAPAGPFIVDVSSSDPPPRSSRPPRTGRPHWAFAAVFVIGLAMGALGVAAFTVAPRAPNPILLTVDSFPREILGQTREGITFRDAGATEAVKRLDAQFQEQLRSYRFAYGGDGAQLTYDGLALTIVNGRLVTSVPTSGDSGDGPDGPVIVSLKSDETSCVSEQPPEPEPPHGNVQLDPGGGIIRTWQYEDETWTDCVLTDTTRNLSLRLTGYAALDSADAITTAGLFRDELERIHADLID